MDILQTETMVLKVADLHPNEGQIKGVPANPRTITKTEFEKLCKSLRESNLTGVLQMKVFDNGGEWVVLDGNMRLKALKQLQLDEVQCLIVPSDTDVDTLRQIVIEANSTFGEWDMDMLANEWDAEQLLGWGVEVPTNEIDPNETIERASSDEAIKDFSDDTDYDLTNLYRKRCNENIVKRIDEGVKNGQIRPEIEEALRTRAKQCSIYNFDEICKYYRSGDATEIEKELLRRLYLVFVAPKELVEAGILGIKEITNKLYDVELMTKAGKDEDYDD